MNIVFGCNLEICIEIRGIWKHKFIHILSKPSSANTKVGRPKPRNTTNIFSRDIPIWPNIHIQAEEMTPLS